MTDFAGEMSAELHRMLKKCLVDQTVEYCAECYAFKMASLPEWETRDGKTVATWRGEGVYDLIEKHCATGWIGAAEWELLKSCYGG